MSKTHTIASDRNVLTRHLTACLDSDAADATVAGIVAVAVRDYLGVYGKRFDKRVADFVQDALVRAGYEGAQAWWHKSSMHGLSADRFAVHYRLRGAGDYKSCRVFPFATPEYREWCETYCDGPNGCEKRLNDIRNARSGVEAIVDGILAVRSAQAGLRHLLRYDECPSDMHPLAYEVSEARDFRS